MRMTEKEQATLFSQIRQRGLVENRCHSYLDQSKAYLGGTSFISNIHTYNTSKQNLYDQVLLFLLEPKLWKTHRSRATISTKQSQQLPIRHILVIFRKNNLMMVSNFLPF